MKNLLTMTRALPGAAKACKAFRKGFDSLPRLHFYIEYNRDLSRIMGKPVTVRRLHELVLHHHSKHAELATKCSEQRDQIIELKKELSRLKRGTK